MSVRGGNFMIDIKKEMLFWNDIMSEHGAFQMASLSCKEKEMFNVANKFYLACGRAN